MTSELIYCASDCEVACELGSLGRVCPTPAQYREEMRELTRLLDVAQPQFAS